MSTTCHRCGALATEGTHFCSEQIPFRGTRIYCPNCHAQYVNRFLLWTFLINIVFGLFGIIRLLLDPLSRIGHVYLNLFLVPSLFWLSVLIHEFAHAIVGNLAGLKVLKIWIGRGNTFYRAHIFGFDTEFKIIPIGGLTVLAHGLQDKLRSRSFLAILAGPFMNVMILTLAWRFASWQHFDIGTSIQFVVITFVTQVLILIENLSPYRIQTGIGTICTDGLSLFQLLVSKSPDVLNSRSVGEPPFRP